MTRPCTRFLPILVALVMAAGALAAQPPALSGIALPETIAGAERMQPRDFESKTPGLGYGIEYRLPGWKIDVFVYDLRQPAIPEDVQSAPVRGQLTQATGDIVKAYAKVETRLRYAILDEAARVRFLCTSFGYIDKQGTRDSYLCVTSHKSKFVKFRLTTDRRAGSDAEANDFVKAWIGVLWPGS